MHCILPNGEVLCSPLVSLLWMFALVLIDWMSYHCQVTFYFDYVILNPLCFLKYSKQD